MVLDEERQIGRDAFIAWVDDRLADGDHLLLLGDRQIGKSSVFRAAGQRRARRGTAVAFTDLFAYHDTPAKFVQAAVGGLSSQAYVAERRAVGAVRMAAAAAADLARMRTVAQRVSAQPSVDVTAALLEIAQVLSRSRRRGLLIIDEAHVIGDWGTEGQRVLDGLYRIAGLEGRPLLLGLSSSDESALRVLLGHRLMWLMQRPPFPEIAREDWHAGLTARFEQVAITIGQGELDAIINAFAGHPFKTMYVARESGRLALAEDRRVSREHVDAVIDAARMQPWAQL